MKDRVYMVLAFLGFIVLCIVYVFNSDSTKMFVQYDAVDSYYVPKDQAYNNDMAANQIFEEMNGSRSVHCPQTELKRALAITPNSIASGNERSAYGVTCFPVNAYVTGMTDAITGPEKLDQITNISGVAPVTLTQLGAVDVGAQYELIAPFSFVFGNNNTDSDKTIVLVSTTGNCRITFSNVSNWFCAGPVGTVSQTGSGTYENETSWDMHDGKHLSVMGKSNNAIVDHGSSGYVVGYGTTETTILVEKLTDDGYKPISLREFMTTMTTN